MKKLYFKRFSIIFSFVLLFGLLLSCLILSASSGQVAFAFDDEGFVMPNLFENNLFSEVPSGSTYGYLALNEYWALSGSGSDNRRIFDNSFLVSSVYSTAGNYANLRYNISDFERGVDYHFRIQTLGRTRNLHGSLVQIWYYPVGSNSPVQGYTTGYQTNFDYLDGTFQLPDDSSYDRFFFIIQTNGVLSLLYAKLERGSIFSGYVGKNYYNYGYNQGLDYNFNQGLELIEKNSIRNDLSINNAISTGNINIPVNNNQLITLQLDGMEQHVKNTLTTYTPYNILDSGLLYNCLYPQNSVAGWYGAKISVNNLGIYDFIPANSTFYLDIDSCFGVYLSGNTYFKGRNKLFVCFFDSKNQLITLNNNGSYSETNFCYNLANYSDLTDYSSVITGLVNFPTQFDSTYKDKALVCWLTDSSTMYFNLPYNVSYVGIFSYFDSDQTYYCYSGKLGYLPSNDYTAGFEQGFDSGKIVGFTQGKNQGYSDAKEYYERYGADYSFMGLMTSVVDAPVQVIGRILDFEIFGYNMRAFFFSILAIALVLLIVGKFV